MLYNQFFWGGHGLFSGISLFFAFKSCSSMYGNYGFSENTHDEMAQDCSKWKYGNGLDNNCDDNISHDGKIIAIMIII